MEDHKKCKHYRYGYCKLAKIDTDDGRKEKLSCYEVHRDYCKKMKEMKEEYERKINEICLKIRR